MQDYTNQGLPISEAQREWVHEKIFALSNRFSGLEFTSISIRGDRNLYRVSVAGEFHSRAIHASSSSYNFTEAVQILRKKVLRQVYSIRGKNKFERPQITI